MSSARRLLNLKTICLVATLVFLVACYFAARKVMVWDVELGMSRAEVIRLLGEPIEFGLSFDSRSSPDCWEQTIVNDKTYRRLIGIYYDDEGKVNLICVVNKLFGHEFVSSRGNITPLWLR